MDVIKEFSALPPEDKVSFVSEDPNKDCRLITSTGNYDRPGGCSSLAPCPPTPCHPSEKFMPLWPQQPVNNIGKNYITCICTSRGSRNASEIRVFFFFLVKMKMHRAEWKDKAGMLI